ncbi:Sucrase/ferredoxin-like-domain-containing protein [Radiomyces spectabilis]|uniref:Sucrase/ferredoxin-like-domain-containing protein n=1 Tax=Radiomyces spectabilis TaxID=64574 RepID=UPI00221F7CEA|nr:Sucrase/ferredoxin-like-domain-containing protein [Radiomyces spectabilis]KAI8370657.1 Sucrase/ferredoxin-like-domain-containing protein [Radiomyces spectabilis]
MASLLQKLSSVLPGKSAETSNSNSHNEHGEVEIDQIPPDDLLVEDACDSCPAPCEDHKQYPSYLDFDKDSPLLGSMLPYGRHIMISTGQSDWAERIEEDTGTLAANLQAILKERPTDWRTFVTNTSALAPHSTVTDGHDITILPDNIIVANVTPDKAEQFYQQFVNVPLPAETYNINQVKEEAEKKGDFAVYKNPYDSMILICSHRKRDKRCGVTAPILAREFDNVLREKDIIEGEGGAAVLMVSHIGGHKFAGNIIVYTDQGKRGVWYGRVNSCHCQAIVEKTILEGKVLKELYRGSMSHSFGPAGCNRHAW